MKITDILSPHHYGRGGYGVLQIVIHTMEAPEDRNRARWCAKYFQTPGLEASAHYCIDNRNVVRSVPDNMGAWACPFFNRSGLQIEHAGYASQSASDWQDDYSQAMLHLSAQLAAEKATQYDIPVRHLTLDQVRKGTVKGFMGHWDATKAGVGGNTHTDPGPHFPWGQYLKMVKAYQKGDTPPAPKPPKGSKPEPHPVGRGPKPDPVDVDGVMGYDSTAAVFWLANVPPEKHPVFSGQPSSIWSTDAQETLRICWPTLSPGSAGSLSIAWLQQQVGVKPDGYFGPYTIKALQKFLGVKVDGLPGYATVKALQRWINKKLKESK